MCFTCSVLFQKAMINPAKWFKLSASPGSRKVRGTVSVEYPQKRQRETSHSLPHRMICYFRSQENTVFTTFLYVDNLTSLYPHHSSRESKHNIMPLFAGKLLAFYCVAH